MKLSIAIFVSLFPLAVQAQDISVVDAPTDASQDIGISVENPTYANIPPLDEISVIEVSSDANQDIPVSIDAPTDANIDGSASGDIPVVGDTTPEADADISVVDGNDDGIVAVEADVVTPETPLEAETASMIPDDDRDDEKPGRIFTNTTGKNLLCVAKGAKSKCVIRKKTDQAG